jgi:drug/metabolite transporter (DMT)-like permease
LKKTWPIEFVSLGAIWGASFFLTHIASPEFGILATASMRVTVAAIVLLGLVQIMGLMQDLKQHWKATFLIGIVNSALPFALFAYAVRHINTGLIAILNATVPLFGALIAWLWLKDTLSTIRIMGLLLGFLGIALLTGEAASFKEGGSGIAVLACMGAAICYGLAGSLTKRYLSQVNPLASAAGSQIGASLVLLVPCVLSWPATMPSNAAWASVVALGVICTALAYVLYFRIIVQVGPAKSLTVTFLIPVFAMMYGVVLLNEKVTLWMLGCGLITVLGTALSTGLIKLGQQKN